VSLERTFDRSYYQSDEIFARERERIFFSEWFCVGRETEVPLPGDFAVKRVVGESILVVRTATGSLAAHYNVCRHRGSQLVPETQHGRFSGGIRCPYHSWTYTLEGALRTAPFLDERDGLARGSLSLHPVAVDAWGGFVFVNLVETDMLWGHRNDPVNFHRCLQDFDRSLPDLLDALRPGDLLILTSDHGCDPTTPSTDHSREHAMLLAYVEGRNASGGIHEGEFADVGATVNAWLNGKAPSRGIPGQPVVTP